MNKPFKLTPALPIMADVTVSISDLKKNPAAVIEEARKRQVAITSRNRAVAYVVSPEVWDHVLDVFDERKLIREAEAALEEEGDDVLIDLDDYL
jgi:antitoxin StbD